jgi:hypothetical protein
LHSDLGKGKISKTYHVNKYLPCIIDPWSQAFEHNIGDKTPVPLLLGPNNGYSADVAMWIALRSMACAMPKEMNTRSSNLKSFNVNVGNLPGVHATCLTADGYNVLVLCGPDCRSRCCKSKLSV